MDDIKITDLPDGGAAVEDEDGVTIYTAEEVAEMERDYLQSLERLNQKQGGSEVRGMEEQRVREIVKEEIKRIEEDLDTFRQEIHQALTQISLTLETNMNKLIEDYKNSYKNAAIEIMEKIKRSNQ